MVFCNIKVSKNGTKWTSQIPPRAKALWPRGPGFWSMVEEVAFSNTPVAQRPANFVFSIKFYCFWVDVGRLWTVQKLQKIAKSRLRSVFGTQFGLRCELLTILARFLRIVHRFWKDSGGILEGLWNDNK